MSRYVVCVAGRLSARVRNALEQLDLDLQVVETTRIRPVRDDAQLHSLLELVQDLGLELVAIEQVPDASGLPEPS